MEPDASDRTLSYMLQSAGWLPSLVAITGVLWGAWCILRALGAPAGRRDAWVARLAAAAQVLCTLAVAVIAWELVEAGRASVLTMHERRGVFGGSECLVFIAGCSKAGMHALFPAVAAVLCALGRFILTLRACA